MLNRDIILQAKNNRDRVVTCNVEGIGDFTVLALDMKQKNKLDNKIASLRESLKEDDFIVEMSKLALLHCLCDEEGQKVLREEDLEGLEELPAVYNEVVKECLGVNYMLPKQVDEAIKKSSPQQEN